MLSISAPSKFVLTLQSVPPFFLESFLAFILVILLAIPLIARAQMLLENPMNYFPPVPRKHPPIFPPPSREQPPTPAINVNLQLDTIRSNPLSSPSPEDELNFDIQLLPLIRKKSLQTCPSDTSTHDYELYRHNFIELNLKKQFGERIPGNVVLNAHHLSTIDSKILLKVNRNFPENLFDFIEPPSTRKVKPHPPQPHPTDHFLPRNSKNPSKNLISIDKAIGTLDPSLEIDQVPELIDFKERTTPTSPRSPRRLAESADNVKILNTRNSRKKLESTSSLPTSSPVRPDNQVRTRTQDQRQVETRRRPLKPPRLRTDRSEVLDVRTLKESGPDRSSITCPSVASSEAFSINSSSSKQPDRVISRPTSSCGSNKGFRNFGPRVNSRPRSGGFFGWDIPDCPDPLNSPASFDPNDYPRPLIAIDHPGTLGDDQAVREIRHTENSVKSNAVEKKVRTDGLLPEPSSLPQSRLDELNDVTADGDQSSSALHPQCTEERMRKSRLPVRLTETSRKVVKKNSLVDKIGWESRKKEDFALQVSASVIKSGIDDNYRNSFGGDKQLLGGGGGQGGETNQELSGETIGVVMPEKGERGEGKMGEVNISNQTDHVESESSRDAT